MLVGGPVTVIVGTSVDGFVSELPSKSDGRFVGKLVSGVVGALVNGPVTDPAGALVLVEALTGNLVQDSSVRWLDDL